MSIVHEAAKPFLTTPSPVGAEVIPPASVDLESTDPGAMLDEALTSKQLQVFSSSNPEVADAVEARAKALHTEVYLEKGFITEADLSDEGVFVDEYSERSTYLHAVSSSKLAAARCIHAEKGGTGVLSFPTTKHFSVDPEELVKAASVRSVADIKPEEVVEISGLVASKQSESPEGNLDATVSLYTSMLRESLEQGHSLWLLNVEKGFLRYLNFMVGREQVHVLGPEKEYMGPATVPVAINPREVVRAALTDTGPGSDMKRDHLKTLLADVNDSKIPGDLRKLLHEHEISTTESSGVTRMLKNPKALAYAGIMTYSSARVAPASTVDEFEGSAALLWGIDVATAVPYTWGAIEAFSGKSLPRRVLGSLVAGASFSAPYAYFEAAAAQDYPPHVRWVVGAFIGAAITKEAVTQTMRRRKDHLIQRGLRASGLPNGEQDTEVVSGTSVSSEQNTGEQVGRHKAPKALNGRHKAR